MSLISVSPPTDPVTASAESLTAIFQFLTSAAGQKLIIQGDDAFIAIVKDIIAIFHKKQLQQVIEPTPKS